VPEATVITGKACGGAYDVMASKHIKHPALAEFCGSWGARESRAPGEISEQTA
jgi:acetyl-CoA carboxylase carboxyltransferase component